MLNLLPPELIEHIYTCLPQGEWNRLALVGHAYYDIFRSLLHPCTNNQELYQACKEDRVEDIKISLRRPRFCISRALLASIGRKSCNEYLKRYIRKHCPDAEINMESFIKKRAQYGEKIDFDKEAERDNLNVNDVRYFALLGACKGNNRVLVKEIMNKSFSYDITIAIYYADSYGHHDLARYLTTFPHDFDLLTIMTTGRTGKVELLENLHISYVGSKTAYLVGKHGHWPVIKHLLQVSQNPHTSVNDYLSGAYRRGHYDVIQKILEHYPKAEQFSIYSILKSGNYKDLPRGTGNVFWLKYACSLGDLDAFLWILGDKPVEMNKIAFMMKLASNSGNLELVRRVNELYDDHFNIAILFGE